MIQVTWNFGTVEHAQLAIAAVEQALKGNPVPPQLPLPDPVRAKPEKKPG